MEMKIEELPIAEQLPIVEQPPKLSKEQPAKTTKQKATQAKTTQAKTTQAKTTQAKTTQAKTTQAKTTQAKPLKSAMKTPQSAPKPKQSITYDSILENMGLCVYNDTLHELSKKVEDKDQENANVYPHVNKKPRNIPQNGYIYSKFNRHYVQPTQTQQPVQPQPRMQPQRPLTQTPAAKEYRNKLIRQIVHNNLAKKQVPPNKTLIISNF